MASDVTNVAWEDTSAGTPEFSEGGDFTFCDTTNCNDSDSSCGGGS